MKKLKKKVAVISILVCSLFVTQVTSVKAAESTSSSSSTFKNNLRLQDDFYAAINKQWLSNAKIESGHMSNSTFDEVNEKVTEQKKQIIKDLLENENSYSENSDEKKIINLYKNSLDTEDRNKQGMQPITGILNKIKSIKSLDDVTDLSEDYEIENPIIQFGCDVDLKDATRNALYVSPTALSLGDSDEYVKPTENGKRIKELTENYYNNILILSGYSKEQAQAKVDNLFKFENMIAKSITGKEESSKDDDAIDKQYNVYTVNELDSLAPNLKIETIMKNLDVDNARRIIVTEPKWFKALNDIYTEENLPLIKDYIEIMNLSSASRYLGEDFEKASTDFSSQLLGIKGEKPKDEKAISLVNSTLGNAFGKMYVDKYFSDETKNNVKEMTDEIIETYKKRIDNLDWMSDTTKKRAIEKLDKLNVHIGYPDKWEDYSKLEIRSYTEGGSLWENIMNLTEFSREKEINKLNEPVDKTEFACNPQTVNAFYQPTSNTITVPAGILQGEFYDADASKERNLGAIGAVIGHEISHAFDNNGAKFDADGDLNSWWTDEDYKKFEEKTNKVRSFYNNVKLDNGKSVNGNLTVGENIADIGGVACALDILNSMSNPDYKAFFESNSSMWREIDTQEYANYRLEYDAHSPNKVRANVVLAQFDKFYETYGINEGDKMYIKPEDRLQIW